MVDTIISAPVQSILQFQSLVLNMKLIFCCPVSCPSHIVHAVLCLLSSLSFSVLDVVCQCPLGGRSVRLIFSSYQHFAVQIQSKTKKTSIIVCWTKRFITAWCFLISFLVMAYPLLWFQLCITKHTSQKLTDQDKLTLQ